MKDRITSGLLMFLIFVILSSCNSQGKIDAYQSELVRTIGETKNDLFFNANLIYHDSKSNYWFENESGIYKYNGENVFLFTTKDGLISNRVLSVQEDKVGNIYFDTPQGVSKFDGKKFTSLEVAESTNNNNEWKSESTDLWFRMGWEHNGPFRYDGKYLHHLQFPKSNIEDEFYKKYPNVSYNPYSIFSMYEDSKGNIWFGTSDLGIYRFDGNKIRWMYEEYLGTTQDGGNFGIRSIAEDKDGFFWICNSKYKYKILPVSEGNFDHNLIDYKREEGIVGDDKEVLYFMGIVADDNGYLWMINEDGVWQNNGKELIQFFIKDRGEEISPTSIYKDNQGIIWFGTQKNGIYKYNGIVFEKFKLERKK